MNYWLPRGDTIAREGHSLDFNAQTPGKPEIGYWLNFSPPPDVHTHEFCGPNIILGAHCPNCDKPLLKLAAFSAADPALELDPARVPSLPLLYCWTCAIPYGDFRYRIQPDGSVKIVTFLDRYEDAFGPDGPYDGYTGHFPPMTFCLDRQSDEEQVLLCSHYEGINRELPHPLDDPRHQVGGHPMIYNPESDICPQCGAEMPTFASITDNALGNGYAERAEDSFVDNCGVQTVFLLCRKCSIVSAYHSSD